MYSMTVGFAISAAALGGLCLSFVISRKLFRRSWRKAFLVLCISAAVSPLFSILDAVLHECLPVTQAARNGMFAVELGYFLFHDALAPAYAIYLAGIGGGLSERPTRRQVLLYAVPAAVDLGCNLANLLMRPGERLFYDVIVVGDKLSYVRGELIYVIYGIAFYYLILALVTTVRRRNGIFQRRARDFAVYYLILLGGVIIQLVFPAIQIEVFAESLAILGFLTILETDNACIDHATGLYNERELFSDVSRAIDKKKRFFVLTVVLQNNVLLSLDPNDDVLSRVWLQIANYLSDRFPDYPRYRTETSHFALLLDTPERDEANAALEELERRFAGTWKLNVSDIWLDTSMTLACVPDDLDNSRQLPYLFRSSSRYQKSSNVRTGQELSFIKKRKPIEEAIGRGIRDGNFRMYYQPIVETATGRVVSAEGLIRLIDPVLGLVSPMDFVPIMEDNGTMRSIGKWLFEDAARFWQEGGLKELGLRCIELNVSMYQLYDNDLIPDFLAALEKYGLQPGDINLELTESVEVELQVFSKQIDALIEAGFSLSLDDYGTGYTNLNRLIHSRAINVKLDRSLIVEAELNPEADRVLQQTYEMLRSLGKRTIQEGVETENQRRRAEEVGADMIQGYYYSRPLPENEFLAWLRERKKNEFPGEDDWK